MKEYFQIHLTHAGFVSDDFAGAHQIFLKHISKNLNLHFRKKISVVAVTFLYYCYSFQMTIVLDEYFIIERYFLLYVDWNR